MAGRRGSAFGWVVRLHHNTRLKYKLIAAFSLLVLFPALLIGTVTYSIFKSRMIEAQQHSIQQSVSQLNNAIDSFLEIYFNKSQTLIDNPQMQTELRERNENIDEIVQSHYTINSILKDLIGDLKYPYLKHSYYFGGNLQLRIYVRNETLFSDGRSIFPYGDLDQEPWFAAFRKSGRKFMWQSGIKDASGNSYIALTRTLIDFDSREELGVMQLLIPAERFANIIAQNNLISDSRFYFLDGDNRLIATNGNASDPLPWESFAGLPEADGIYDAKVDGRAWIGGYQLSAMTGWKLVYFMPLDIVTKTVDTIRNVTALIGGGSLLVSILLAILLSSYLTRRISVLVRKTNRIQESADLVIDAVIPGRDEIGQLDKNFNRMIKRLREMIDREYKTKALIDQTKLELLQQQINPHLHYNALGMISSLAKQNGQQDILRVTNHLIQFYKGILNKGKILSSLGAELELVSHYIEIAKFVYGLDIDTSVEVEEEVLGYYSLKLFLQPVVENAVLHGIKPLKRGNLYISGRAEDHRIVFTVADDGAGMDADVLARLQSQLSNPSQELGYGLGNVMRRLNLFFGEPYGIAIESAPGMGTSVAIAIPKYTEEEIKRRLGGSL
ncbi:cache domain-containing sensor histidine kinase [Cohnella caldifontis]|uniref:cache domain-containing sensor histidine kinase n=1 Tax=Cohnella caldifontis TaxID=3027471 RepID=UPI0023EC65EE|nr:cache domain-containing protein [Cohnella sp. YIM B05605]